MSTGWGLHSGYAVSVTAPLIVPVWCGVKVTPNVQDTPGTKLGERPHGWAPAETTLKSPLTVIGINESPSRSRLLLTTTICAALVVPTRCAGKVREAGVNWASGRMLEDSGTTAGLELLLSTITTDPGALCGANALSGG